MNMESEISKILFNRGRGDMKKEERGKESLAQHTIYIK